MFPDTKFLDQMGKCNINWINNNLYEFNPFKNASKIDPLRSKAVVELSFMCMYYNRCRNVNRDESIQKCIDFLLDIVNKPIYREKLIRSPALLPLYGTVYVALRKCGFDDLYLRGMFQSVLDQGYATKVERIGFRKMDLCYLLDCGDFENDLRPIENLYKETILSKKPPILYLLDSDVYSITHTLFYITDFGDRPIPFSLQDQLEEVRWLVATLLGLYLRENNWDIVGELLLCCICLHWRPPIIYEVAWEGIMHNQNADGSISGPSFSSEHLNKLNEKERASYCFEQNYHTTLVALMACFLTKTAIIKGELL